MLSKDLETLAFIQRGILTKNEAEAERLEKMFRTIKYCCIAMTTAIICLTAVTIVMLLK